MNKIKLWVKYPFGRNIPHYEENTNMPMPRAMSFIDWVLFFFRYKKYICGGCEKDMYAKPSALDWTQTCSQTCEDIVCESFDPYENYL